VTPQAFTYDLNGNTSSSGPSGAPTSTYGWDAADRLISVTQGANVTTYDYDGLGRRVREWVNGAETRQWIWDGLELCEERNSSNNVTKRFYGQGEQISGVAYYSTRDHLGSVQELLDGTGSLAAGGLHARYSYDIYGQRSANLVTVNPIATDFGFTGHQQFDAIALLGAPFRFYQPAFGRWLSRDPIGEDGGLNLYGYVRNNPANLIDPLGLDWASWNSVVPPSIGTNPAFASRANTFEPTASLAGLGIAGAVTGASLLPEAGLALAARYPALAAAAAYLSHLFGGTGEDLSSGLGDLTVGEVNAIQAVVNRAGRPLCVVGSAAKGARKPGSDIDYLSSGTSLPYFDGLEHLLPGIDPAHGIIPGAPNPFLGPSILFQPKSFP
jgi:RHS repeat-associated protein